MTASHICHFVSCPKGQKVPLDPWVFFTEALVLSFASAPRCLSDSTAGAGRSCWAGGGFQQWLHFCEASGPGIVRTTWDGRLQPPRGPLSPFPADRSDAQAFTQSEPVCHGGAGPWEAGGPQAPCSAWPGQSFVFQPSYFPHPGSHLCGFAHTPTPAMHL